MNITKQDLFVTPVWEIQTDLDDYFNSILLNDIAELAKDGLQYNIWKSNNYSISKLKDTLFECLDATVKDCFPYFNPYDPCLLDGWANKTKPGEGLTLHGHPHAVLISVYYATCPENSGDLFLVDPRGTVNWDWHYDTIPKLVHGTGYRRITPKKGKMVIFPAYVMHMVEANRSTLDRISVASNIGNNIGSLDFTLRP
jgi:hypothetical protein